MFSFVSTFDVRNNDNIQAAVGLRRFGRGCDVRMRISLGWLGREKHVLETESNGLSERIYNL